jgi:hypothetical protein
MDLASVNYLHYGAPKSWYCIPPAHRERFERVLQGLLPDMFRACPEFLRHKVRVATPFLPFFAGERNPWLLVLACGAHRCSFLATSCQQADS